VTETIWHPTQQAKTHKDGSVTLTFEVDGLNEILHWLLSWAGRVTIQQPDELKSQFLKALHDAIQMQASNADA
jgi:proteasome accessory factor B